MKIVWTPEARQDRFEIWARIARDDPYAAVHMDERFGTAAARLRDHPELGREGLIPGTREFVVHESYQLGYEIEQARREVRILALVHTRRLWPPLQSE